MIHTETCFRNQRKRISEAFLITLLSGDRTPMKSSVSAAAKSFHCQRHQRDSCTQTSSSLKWRQTDCFIDGVFMVNKEIIRRYTTLRQCARGVGLVALVFSFTVAVLLTENATRATPEKTVRNEVLSQVLSQSRTEQNPEQIRFAREMDQLARRAYFSSLTFRQGGVLLLVMGLLTTALCFGVAWRLSLNIPDPRERGGHDPAHSDRLAVQAVLVSALLLLAGAIMLQIKHHRQARSTPDRELRARLINQKLKPGETHVCPCRQGTSAQDLSSQWPFLRGPTHSGRTSLTNFPLSWNAETGEHIKWKTALFTGGSSTPVVWNQRVFLTTGTPKSREVLAYNSETGELLWQTTIPDGTKTGAPLPDVMEETGLAASTPACDERHVYAIFATGDLVALSHEGEIVWQTFLERPANTYGHASSLIYCGNMLIVQWDQEKNGRILAIDKNSGKILWDTPHEVGMSWSTPVIMPVCDHLVLIVHATRHTWGLELATGRKLWDVDAVGGEVAPSLAWEGDIWLAANCYARMAAFRMPPEGSPELLWEWDEGNLPDVASPVILDGLVYLVTDAGEVSCHNLTDGKELWRKEFEDGYYASPIAANGHIYVVDRGKGLFRVYATGREGREVATNPMGEAISATPAFANGYIYVRGKKHLWCIGP